MCLPGHFREWPGSFFWSVAPGPQVQNYDLSLAAQATGGSQTVEAVKQLRGEAGKRQVDGAEVALNHNVGGIGQYCFVHVYKRS